MLLWVFLVIVLLSASAVLYLAVGPFRSTPVVWVYWVLALLQYGAAALVLSRLLGWV